MREEKVTFQKNEFYLDHVQKNTPGERCNCDTITRSVPLITNEPVFVIKGISPMYTSCSLISFVVGLDASLSIIVNRTLARSGEA